MGLRKISGRFEIVNFLMQITFTTTDNKWSIICNFIRGISEAA